MNSRIIVFLIIVFIWAGCTRQAPDTPESVSVIITTIKEEGGRVDWSHTLNCIVFDKPGEDGYYDIYSMNPDGSNTYCLTCDIDLSHHHVGNPVWHPSGEWIVFQAVNTSLIPLSMDQKIVTQYTNPGAGWLNNLWVMNRDKTKVYQLTDINTEGGVLHPYFNYNGTELVWAERVEGDTGSGPSGVWVLKVADFVAVPEPYLDNIRVFTPGEQQGFRETHGFSPDGTKILFSGNLEKDQPMWGMDIYELDIKTEKVTRLTHTMYEWDEHAVYSTDGTKIVWMSSSGYTMDPLKSDFWMMNSDGSHKEQITFFNIPGHPHYMNRAIVCADSSWGPDGRIIAYIKTESEGVGSTGGLIMIEFGNYISGFKIF